MKITLKPRYFEPYLIRLEISTTHSTYRRERMWFWIWFNLPFFFFIIINNISCIFNPKQSGLYAFALYLYVCMKRIAPTYKMSEVPSNSVYYYYFYSRGWCGCCKYVCVGVEKPKWALRWSKLYPFQTKYTQIKILHDIINTWIIFCCWLKHIDIVIIYL